MAKQHPIELFMPPNTLKAKVGGSGTGLDVAAITRAEAAVDTLKSEFNDWVGSDVQKLVETHDQFSASPTIEATAALFRASLDIKGQAATFDFPLIARVASSLCKLLEESRRETLQASLVDAHVAAIRVIFRDQIRDADDAIATTLASELETRTAEALKPRR